MPWYRAKIIGLFLLFGPLLLSMGACAPEVPIPAGASSPPSPPEAEDEVARFGSSAIDFILQVEQEDFPNVDAYALLENDSLIVGALARHDPDAEFDRWVQVEKSHSGITRGQIDSLLNLGMPPRLLDIGEKAAQQSKLQAVPRAYIAELPFRYLVKVRYLTAQKQTFYGLLLPLVLRANELIRKERKRLISARAQLAEVADLQSKYRSSTHAELMRRIQIIPPSLVLAQASVESGWGWASVYTRDGNAIFGEKTNRGNGGIPPYSDPDSSLVFKVFDHSLDSVISYMLNLNRHRAYKRFRLLRERQGIEINFDSNLLATALNLYADGPEGGRHYTDALSGSITFNQLKHFDTAKLK